MLAMRNLILFSALSLAAAGQAVVFNDYSKGGFDSGFQYGAGYSNLYEDPSTFFKTREVSLENVVGGRQPVEFYQVQLGNGGGVGRLSVSASSSVSGDFYLRYGYQREVLFDLSATPTIHFDVPTNDRAADFTVTLTDVFDRTTSLNVVAGGGFQSLSFDFSGQTSINLAQVKNIQIYTPLRQAQDFQLGPVSAVPEPASMAVLGLGALGLLRRRKNAAR